MSYLIYFSPAFSRHFAVMTVVVVVARTEWHSSTLHQPSHLSGGVICFVWIEWGLWFHANWAWKHYNLSVREGELFCCVVWRKLWPSNLHIIMTRLYVQVIMERRVELYIGCSLKNIITSAAPVTVQYFSNIHSYSSSWTKYRDPNRISIGLLYACMFFVYCIHYSHFNASLPFSFFLKPWNCMYTQVLEYMNHGASLIISSRMTS